MDGWVIVGQRGEMDQLSCHISVSWIFPGIFFQRDMPGTPPKRAVQGHSIQILKSSQLAPLDVEEQRFYFELLTLSLRGHLGEEAHFTPGILFFRA